MNLPNLEAIIDGRDVRPLKTNSNFLLKVDKGLKMGIGKTPEANNVMGLSSPGNNKFLTAEHSAPMTQLDQRGIHNSDDPFSNLNKIMA